MAGLALWQWAGVAGLFVGAWISGFVFCRVVLAAARRVVKRTKTPWDDALLERVSGPLTVGFGIIVARMALPALSLPRKVESTLLQMLGVLLLATLFWTFARAIDVAQAGVSHSRWAVRHRASRTLLPLGARVTKVALVILALIAVVAQLGVPVGSLLAGIGIGGLALALAGQKTVENLIGAFAIGLDQPLREGDFVKVGDVVGTVEAIGLRSTRVRTLDRTVVAIPNGKLSEMQIESYSERDRMRLSCTLGLVQDSTPEQLREVLGGCERVLREHPRIWPDAISVRLTQFGTSSLDVEIMAWFQTRDFGEFQLFRQEMLISFLEIVRSAGTSIAYPTQIVRLVEDAEPPSAPRRRSREPSPEIHESSRPGRNGV